MTDVLLPMAILLLSLGSSITETIHNRESSPANFYPFGEEHRDTDFLKRSNLKEPIDLGFKFIYFGFSFGGVWLAKNGVVAFSYPSAVRPPYRYPSSSFPTNPDPSFIALLPKHRERGSGRNGSSHIRYRSMKRLSGDLPDSEASDASSDESNHINDMQTLDEVTAAIRENDISAVSFKANNGFIVTWKTTAPQTREPDNTKRLLQLILATDGVRSYVLVNVNNGRISDTDKSTSESTIAFNAGNNTGYYKFSTGDLGFTAEKTDSSGGKSWIFRVDEVLEQVGCSSGDSGRLKVYPTNATTLGGFKLKVSGPCFAEEDRPRILLADLEIQCTVVSRLVAECIVPSVRTNSTGAFPIGAVEVKTRDSKYIGRFEFQPPEVAMPGANMTGCNPARMDGWNCEVMDLVWNRSALDVGPGERINIWIWSYNDQTSTWNEAMTYVTDLRNNGYLGIKALPLMAVRMLDVSNKYAILQVKPVQRNSQLALWSRPIPITWLFDGTSRAPGYRQNLCAEWTKQISEDRCSKEHLCPCEFKNYYDPAGRYRRVSLYHHVENCGSFDATSNCPYGTEANHCIFMPFATKLDSCISICCYNGDKLVKGVSRSMKKKSDVAMARYPRFYEYTKYELPREACCAGEGGNCSLIDRTAETSCTNATDMRKTTMFRALSTRTGVELAKEKYKIVATSWTDPEALGHTKVDCTGYYQLGKFSDGANKANVALTVQVRLERLTMDVKSQTEESIQRVAGSTVLTGVAVKDSSSGELIKILARPQGRVTGRQGTWNSEPGPSCDIYVNGQRIMFQSPLESQYRSNGALIWTEESFGFYDMSIVFDMGLSMKVTSDPGSINVTIGGVSDVGIVANDGYGFVSQLATDHNVCRPEYEVPRRSSVFGAGDLFVYGKVN